MCSREGLWASLLVLAGSLHALSFSSSLHKPFPASFPPNLFAVTSLQPMINSRGETVLSLVTRQNVHLYSCIAKSISISLATLRKHIPCPKEFIACPGRYHCKAMKCCRFGPFYVLCIIFPIS